MFITKVRIRTKETGNKLEIIRAILESYPLDREIMKENKTNDYDQETEFLFHMKSGMEQLLNHDLNLLKICGYKIRKA